MNNPFTILLSSSGMTSPLNSILKSVWYFFNGVRQVNENTSPSTVSLDSESMYTLVKRPGERERERERERGHSVNKK